MAAPANDWRPVTAIKAWRVAVGSWVLGRRDGGISPGRVSPTFRPGELS